MKDKTIFHRRTDAFFLFQSSQFRSEKALPISGRVDKTFATETVDSGSIPVRVKPKTIKFNIHSFLACRSA